MALADDVVFMRPLINGLSFGRLVAAVKEGDVAAAANLLVAVPDRQFPAECR